MISFLKVMKTFLMEIYLGNFEIMEDDENDRDGIIKIIDIMNTLL